MLTQDYTPSEDLIDHMLSFEGFKPNAYKDSGGVWTIGYGHTLNVKEGDQVTPAGARLMFTQDLDKHVSVVKNLIKDGHTQSQLDVCVDFQYNTGRLSLSLHDLVNRESPEYVSTWLKEHYITDAEGHEEPGLVRRRLWESQQYLNKNNTNNGNSR